MYTFSPSLLAFIASPIESHVRPVLTLILSGDSAGGQVPVDSEPKEERTKGKRGGNKKRCGPKENIVLP